MEEFENLLYKNVGAVLSEREKKTIRVDGFTRSYRRWLSGILLLFLEEGLLLHHRLLHILLLSGAVCFMRELKRYGNGKKSLMVVRWLWLIEIAAVITYDIIAFLNYPYPWRQFCMQNYAYRRWEMRIVGGFLLGMIWCLAQTMIMMAGEKREKEQWNSQKTQDHSAQGTGQRKRDNRKTQESRKREIWCAAGYLMTAAVCLIIFAFFDNTPFWQTVILFLLLWKGVKRMNVVERKICYGDGSRQHFRKFRPVEWIAMTVAFATVAALVSVAMVDPYLTRQAQIDYITEESRWLSCREFSDNILQEKSSGNFEEIDLIEERAAKIRAQLAEKGVDKGILNDLLAADVLRLENTGRVWKSTQNCELRTEENQTDVRYRQENAQKTVTAVIECYVFENFDKPYEYEVLFYVRFNGGRDLTAVCDRIRIADSFMEGESYGGDDDPLEAWIFKNDVGEKTVCYQGKWQQRTEYFKGAETDFPKGENYRAYHLGHLLNDGDHQSDAFRQGEELQQSENQQQDEKLQPSKNQQQDEELQSDDEMYDVTELWVMFTIYQKQDFYDEIKKQTSYEFVRGSLLSGQAGFCLRMHDGQISSFLGTDN